MRFHPYLSPDRRPSRPRSFRERLAVERLEDRTLPSTILWTNRGAPGADTDGFQAVYGVSAVQARAVVDAALDDWEAVIQNFNYRNVGTRGNAPVANTYTLQLSAAALGSPGLRGVTWITGVDDDDKPFRGEIELDDNGGGAGWFIDSTPQDHGEFPNLVTRFAATSPAAGTRDLYRTVLHEIGHALGIANDSRLAIDDLLTDSGVNDPNIAAGDPSEDLLTFSGPSVTATLTSVGGGHLYEGPVVGGLPTHPNDLLNAGRASPAGTRGLITDLDAQILADAYEYTINLPSTIETFIAYRIPTTGVLTVNGDLGVWNDMVTLDKPGASWRVNVNGFVMTFPAASVMGITLNAGTGNDTINVRYTVEGVPVTVNAGSGNDTINVGSAGNSLDAILGAVTVHGEGGVSDVLNINDQNTGAGSEYTLTASSVTRLSAARIAYDTLESLVLNTTRLNDTLTVLSTPGAVDVMLNARGGSDTLVGPNAATTWEITGTNAGLFTGNVAFSSVENLTGGSAADRFLFSNGEGIAGIIDGRTGSDTLDYQQCTTTVAVNLATGSATGTTGVRGLENVTGGTDHDVLIGDAAGNVLRGGGGRNLLIGGLGKDQLIGAAGEDILIGGTTAHDADALALLAVMAEWARTDRTYDQRVDHLRNGGGRNGQTRLTAATVFDDGVVDTLTGLFGLDWFFASDLDSSDRGNGEQLN